MKAVFYTNRGCARETNEDALFVGSRTVCGTDMMSPIFIKIDGDKEIFCVVDGMGGHVGGALAAKITAQAFQAEAEPDNKLWLESALQKAYKGMKEAASYSPELANMGQPWQGL